MIGGGQENRYTMPASTNPPISLPPLLFGDRGAVVNTDAQRFADRMSTVISSLQAYDPLGKPEHFASKSSSVQFNGLKLAAASNTPVRVDVGDTLDMTLMIPLAGSNVTTIGKEALHWVAGQSAIYLPSIARGGECTTRSTLNITLDRGRLERTATAMLGSSEVTPANMHLDQPRVLPLHAHGMALDRVFHHIGGVIDSVNADVDVLSRLGLDDLIYRSVVLLMCPELAAQKPPSRIESSRTGQTRRFIDPLCDYMLAHLDERITLSDMERISNVSARGLQYAFVQRFGCSPMQWLKNARLDWARKQLSVQGKAISITKLALECGFAKPSDFADQYRRRFGELPSESRDRMGVTS